jgi:hypothetical protein
MKATAAAAQAQVKFSRTDAGVATPGELRASFGVRTVIIYLNEDVSAGTWGRYYFRYSGAYQGFGTQAQAKKRAASLLTR